MITIINILVNFICYLKTPNPYSVKVLERLSPREARQGGEHYSKEAATLANSRTKDFLRENLG